MKMSVGGGALGHSSMFPEKQDVCKQNRLWLGAIQLYTNLTHTPSLVCMPRCQVTIEKLYYNFFFSIYSTIFPPHSLSISSPGRALFARDSVPNRELKSWNCYTPRKGLTLDVRRLLFELSQSPMFV